MRCISRRKTDSRCEDGGLEYDRWFVLSTVNNLFSDGQEF